MWVWLSVVLWPGVLARLAISVLGGLTSRHMPVICWQDPVSPGLLAGGLRQLLAPGPFHGAAIRGGAAGQKPQPFPGSSQGCSPTGENPGIWLYPGKGLCEHQEAAPREQPVTVLVLWSWKRRPRERMGRLRPQYVSELILESWGLEWTSGLSPQHPLCATCCTPGLSRPCLARPLCA